MSWWDELWLSKGFAYSLKHKVTEDAILPGWQIVSYSFYNYFDTLFLRLSS